MRMCNQNSSYIRIKIQYTSTETFIKSSIGWNNYEFILILLL